MDVIAGVSAYIQKDGLILLVKRGGGVPMPGCWSLPGGKIQAGETPRRALRREVAEETGLRIRVLEIIDAVAAANHYLVVCYRCLVVSGDLRAGDDAAAAEWVPAAQVLRRRTTPGLAAIMRLAASNASTSARRAERTRPDARGR